MRLTGYLSYVDGKKLVFEYIGGRDENDHESTSRQTLDRHYASCEHPPHDSRSFRVHVRDVTDDIRGMVGRQCVVTVYTQRYSFSSRAGHNRGERVQGEKLMLDTIGLLRP